MRLVIITMFAVTAACQTFAQHRAALVPHATPLPTDGQPLQGAGEVSLGATNVMDVVTPGAGNPDAGDAVPSTQLRGSLSGRINDVISLGGVYERGLASGSHAITSSQPPVDNGDVAGYGVNGTFSVPTSVPGLRVGVSVELLVWSVPWVQYTVCVQNCLPGPSYAVMDKGTDTVATFALGVIPSYRVGRLTVFGGATIRNHPTITEKILTDEPGDAEVRGGPFNLTVHVGAAVDLGGGVRASLLLDQTVTADPVSYGPGVAAMLAIPFGGNSAHGRQPPGASSP